MKAVVVYKSKTGYTEKYAQKIAGELSANLYKAKEIKGENLKEYDTIIYGGGLYAGIINGVKIIKKNFENIKEKNIIVFSTGVSPADDKMIEQYKTSNFTKEQLENIQFYYLRGGFNYNKLGIIDKLMMNIIKSIIKSKNKKGETVTSDDVGMLSIFDAPVDYTEEGNINEIVGAAKK